RLFFMSVLVVDGLYSFTWYGSAGAGQPESMKTRGLSQLYSKMRFIAELLKSLISGKAVIPKKILTTSQTAEKSDWTSSTMMPEETYLKLR
ncbi:hypothetical protein, partial [Xanthomonas campestris]